MTSIDIADINRKSGRSHVVKSTSNSYIIAHAEFVFLLTIINSIIRTRC